LVLELGCGTGRVSVPLAKAGIDLVGIDRSADMLARLRVRASRARLGGDGPRRSRAPRSRVDAVAHPRLHPVRGDIRSLPFADGVFSTVIAPYGILQSLLRDRDLKATLDAVARALRRGGTFGIDLVPDVPNWQEYANRIQHRGRGPGGAHFTLIESVRQDRRRRLTTFEQRYLVRRRGGTAEHRFHLMFRSLTMRQMASRLDTAGFSVESVLGSYQGRPWDARADVWIILAKKR
jgi:SAM-dependent methyltransferase